MSRIIFYLLMTIDDRLRLLLSKKRITSEFLADSTGIKYGRWTTVRKTNGRARAEDIEAICKLFPQYAFWLATGKIAPEIGQTSPELDEISNSDSGAVNAG